LILSMVFLQRAGLGCEQSCTSQGMAQTLLTHPLYQACPLDMNIGLSPTPWIQAPLPTYACTPNYCRTSLTSYDLAQGPLGKWCKDDREISSAASTADTEEQSEPQCVPIGGFSEPQHQLRVEPNVSGWMRVFWTVDACTPRSRGTQVESPVLEVVFGLQFQLLITAACNSSNGGDGFRAANGKGVIQLKCISGASTELPELTCWFSLKPVNNKMQKRRSLTHDFSASPLCRPREREDWHLDSAVDHASKTFVVCLEVWVD